MYKIINMNEQIDPSTENNFEKEQVLPLLKAQAGMWFMQKLLPPEATLNIAEAIEIHGPIDPDIFKTAMRQTIVEAESLRLRLRESYAGPEQVIDPEYRGRFPYFDVTTEPDQLAAAQQWMHDELNRPVDLLTDPLCQFALFKLADDRFIWYHRYHHIIMDGFGAGLIARRVAELYNMLSENRVSATGPTFGPLSALFEEEQAYRDSQRFVRDREYWMQRFGDKPESANLAVKHSPGMGGVLRRTAYLPAETVAELRSFARATGVSLPQFLIASVAAYLYRMTGMEDLVLGMIVTARSNPRMRQVPGMAANALPLRLKISPEQTVTELLAQVAKEARTVLRHQSYRYDDLRRDLQFTMANGQHLYATVVNIEPFDYDLRFGGHPITPHNLSNAAAENLTVFVYDRGDGQGLRIDFDANSSVYSEEELAGHQERLANFIESMAFDADRPIDRIELLTPSERQRLLVDWNATDVDFTRRHCIHQLIEAQVRKTPHALAVTCGDLSMSYDTLNASANRLAHYLRLLGVKPEARVAICLERSFEMVVSLLAVLKAGGAYVPLDPSYPEDRLVFMLEDCDPDVLLTRHDLAAAFGEATSNVLVVDVYRPELWAKQPAHDPDPKEVGLGPRNLAYMIYTSGSTGKPKGAMNEHRGVVN
ncbi:MAG: condensation domain-containing protein, partial [Gammaproteobacteria bacterium]